MFVLDSLRGYGFYYHMGNPDSIYLEKSAMESDLTLSF